jgi:hypothetical protein
VPAPAPVPRRTGAGSYGRPRGGQSSRAGVEPALQRHRAVRRRRGTSPRRPGCRPSCRSRAARRCLTGKADPGTRRRQVTASGRAGQARENGEYLRRLLSERHPEFLAILRWTEYRVDFELSRESPDWTSSRVPPIKTGTGQDRPSSSAYPRRGSAASVLFLCGSSVRQRDVQESGHAGGVHGVFLTGTPTTPGQHGDCPQFHGWPGLPRSGARAGPGSPERSSGFHLVAGSQALVCSRYSRYGGCRAGRRPVAHPAPGASRRRCRPIYPPGKVCPGPRLSDAGASK